MCTIWMLFYILFAFWKYLKVSEEVLLINAYSLPDGNFMTKIDDAHTVLMWNLEAGLFNLSKTKPECDLTVTFTT